jgi:hypothetical protein
MSASSWRFEPRTGASLRTIALFWKEFSGSRERGRRGVTCPKSSANGRRSIASSGAGQALGRDTRGPERERSVPDALRMIDITVVRAHHQAAALKGDSATGSWPFKRWLHDQNPPPRQLCGPAHEVGHHAKADIGLSGI